MARNIMHAGSMVLLVLSSLIACSPQSTATVVPTATQVTATVAAPQPSTPTLVPPTAIPPTPTQAAFAFPAGSLIAGAEVGGLSVAAATQRVTTAIDRYRRTLTLHAGDFTTPLTATDMFQLPDAEQLVSSGRVGAVDTEPISLPLQLDVDQAALRKYVEGIAPAIEQPAATGIISDAKALTETFTFTEQPGRHLDVDHTVADLSAALVRADAPKQVDLAVDLLHAPRPSFAELERVLREHAGFWTGIAGFYVRDIQTGETLEYNADTVFSGASVMKVPIMIFAYAHLGGLNEQQHNWMRRMIIDSENLDANALLAASVGGEGTEAALEGVNQMTKMLQDLGLQHTYQLIPYESGEWLIQQSLLPHGGPAHEGASPFTAPDPYIRTTPHEMGELFTMLDACAHGSGPLLEKVGGHLNQALCQEMIGWLQQPHDQERMVAGLPPGTPVAHKGGWIDDMQSDVGIVDSPGGRYVAAIYIWRDGYVTDEFAHPSPYLGDFSHTIYTFFNPADPASKVATTSLSATP